MATRLEESTKTARKLGVGCFVFVVAILVLNFIIGVLTPEEVFNPWPTGPDNRFGDLPALTFETIALKEGSSPTYRIETTDGQLPSLLTLVNVYETKLPEQSLLARQEAVDTASALGFGSAPQDIGETQLKWTNGARSLVIDKLYKTIKITTDYASDPGATLQYTVSPDPEQYISHALSIFQGKTMMSVSSLQVDTQATYLKLDKNNTFHRAKSASDANFVRVDLFMKREAISTLLTDAQIELLTDTQKEYVEKNRIQAKTLSENPTESVMFVILGGQNTSTIYELQYINWELSERGIYRSTSVAEAWENIKQNKGYLRYLLEVGGDPYTPYIPLGVKEFLLTSVKMAYYCPTEYPQYLYPVYLFSGIAIFDDDNKQAEFTYYYPAVNP